MSTDVECSSIRGDEGAACARIFAASFARATARELRRDVESEVWVAREAGSVRGLVIVRDRRAGFGGRFVRAACLSSLCIDERERSRGLGTALVASALREAFARGASAAILIPRTEGLRTEGLRTEGLYERLGFTLGGARFSCCFDLPRAPQSPDSEHVRAFTRRDDAAWLALAERAARERNGFVIPTPRDRARRAHAPRRSFVVERTGGVVAALTLSQRLESGGMTLYVHELLALDRAAADAAWAFVTRFSAEARTVRWRAAPADPLADFARAAGARFAERGSWMLRLVDARRFLAERGFAVGASTAFEFALVDPLLPDNERPFTLVVEDGRGSVREGGRGAIRLDIADAAALFSGACSARQLHASGRLRASATELEHLDALFALAPSMLQSLP